MTTNYEDDEPANPRQRRLVTLAGVLLLPLAVIWNPGCREYPAVTSRESLQLVKRLYAACNTRNDTWLREVEMRVQQLTNEGKMTDAEGDGFTKVITLARAANWPDAQTAALKFAQDQVGRGSNDSPGQCCAD